MNKIKPTTIPKPFERKAFKSDLETIKESNQDVISRFFKKHPKPENTVEPTVWALKGFNNA